MKKLMIFLSMILLLDRTYAQKKYYLEPVTIDNEITVSLPKEFKKTDATGQQSWAANAIYGSVLVIRSVNPTDAKLVKNTDGLNNVFKEYVKKIQASSGKDGEITDEHNTTVGKLTAHDFVLQTDTGSGVQMRRFRLLYTKAATYTFEYLYEDFRKDEAIGEMNAFFSSIQTAPDLDHTDQYVITAPGGSSVFVKITLFGLLPLGAIIALVIWLKRRNSMTLT